MSEAAKHPLREAAEAATAELLPCPFCGGESIDIRTNGIGDYFAICYDNDPTEMSCGASTSDSNCETPEGAILRWNTRAPSDENAGLRAALEPFANEFGDDIPRNDDFKLYGNLRLGHFRAARQALGSGK